MFAFTKKYIYEKVFISDHSTNTENEEKFNHILTSELKIIWYLRPNQTLGRKTSTTQQLL